MTSPKGRVYAQVDDEMNAEVIEIRSGGAVLRLDTDERAFLPGTYPEVGSNVRVRVETASNAYERFKGNRDIVVAEIQEKSSAIKAWRAPEQRTIQPVTAKTLAVGGRNVPVVVRKRRILHQPEAS